MPDDFLSIWNYELFTLPNEQALTVGQLVLILALLIGGYFVGRIAAYFVNRKLAGSLIGVDAAQILSRVVFWLILIVVVLTAMSLLSIPLTAFAFISGAVAIGVGFGAQNIINNFISGWILMTERPIRIGDFVEIGGMHGTVEVIGNRSTRIRRVDGVHLMVPNSTLLETTVINWTLVDMSIRAKISVGVAYGSPVKKVAELIDQAVREQPDVKEEPEPLVVFEDFGDNALVFDVYFWRDANSEKDLRALRSSIRFRICELFDEHGIVIAFPQRDVHLDAAAAIPVRVVRGDDE
ncbi:MAG: mechanosensitive ion channel [Woeseiaceae bacterium]|nr:mechanosensitive ion channel [Woeseiaceae bacterium]